MSVAQRLHRLEALEREQRLLRLEEHIPPTPKGDAAWAGWCYPDGAPCEPPEDVRRQAEQAATEPWRAAVWVPDQGLVLLLRCGRYELQVIELDERWEEQRRQ